MATMKDFEIVWDIIKHNKPIGENSSSFSRVKSYIKSNPRDPKSMIIKNMFVELFNKKFNNEDLIRSINISDDYKYYKIVELSKYLPFLFHRDNTSTYFYSTIQHDSDYFGEYYKFVKGCLWFLQNEGKCEIDEEVINKISEHAYENKNVYGYGLTKYDDYETELDRLKKICNGEYPDDFNSFKIGIEYDYRVRGVTNWDINDVIRDYKSSKVGIVGEYNTLKNVLPDDGDFVAKDFGNGYGYDMYWSAMGYDGKRKEVLLEVKSTMNTEDDYFSLSDNEYNVLMDTLDRPNTFYRVVRVFVDLNKQEKYDSKLLYFNKENNTFISTNNEDGNILEYKLDENLKGHVFKRSGKKYINKKN